MRSGRGCDSAGFAERIWSQEIDPEGAVLMRVTSYVACCMMYVCMYVCIMYDVWRVLSRTACSLQDVKKGKPRFYGLDPIFNYGNGPSRC